MKAKQFEINGACLLVNVYWRNTNESFQLVGEIVHKNVEKIDWIGIPSAKDILHMLSTITAFEEQISSQSAPNWAQTGAIEIGSWIIQINEIEMHKYQRELNSVV